VFKFYFPSILLELIHSFYLLVEFSLDKEANMLTCNLFETIHNIWLQQSNNMGKTSNDYVQAFRQPSLYYAFLQGCAYGTGSNKNELRLHRAS
jgi:hypothetical protein